MFNYEFDKGGVYIRNLSNEGDNYGIAQYRYPHNYELVGRSFAVETGDERVCFEFLNKIEASFRGMTLDFEALKITAKIFFVRIGFYFAVLDVEKALATLIVDDKYIIGRLSGDGIGESSAPLHRDAGDDMVGTEVAFTFGYKRKTVHNYCAEGVCRVGWSPLLDVKTEQPCRATYIDEGIYLTDVTGQVHYGVCAPILTERVILLEDYEHMMAVGAVLAGGETPIMVTGYGRFPEEKLVINLPGGATLELE